MFLFKLAGKQGSLTGSKEGRQATISRARGLAQNTRGNPRKHREGERITNTGQDRLTTVSLLKPQNSRIKEEAGGRIISTLLTGDGKTRRAQPRMRF